MENFIISEANLIDAYGIAKVHIKTWQQAYKELLPKSFLDSLSIKKRAKRWKEDLSHPKEENRTFIAKIENQIIGFCTVGPSRDEDINNDIGEVYAIYVDQENANKGMGTALIKEGLGFLKKKGFKKVTLWVLESNIKGRNFYEAKGWIAENKIKSDKVGEKEVKEIRYGIKLY